MNSKPENKISSEEEINLFYYWKTFVKRKKIFISTFLIPFVIVTIASLCIPRHYKGVSEMEMRDNLKVATDIAILIENINESQKDRIFPNYSTAIKSVSASLSKKTNRVNILTDTVTIIVDATTADIIPRAINDIYNYITNLPEIKERLTIIKEENNLKLEKLIEAKKKNQVFLAQMTDMMKTEKVLFVNINPADLIMKDADLSLEIMHLQNTKLTAGILSPPLITKQPSNSRIINIILVTGILSLMISIFVIFFLDHIERMKKRE